MSSLEYINVFLDHDVIHCWNLLVTYYSSATILCYVLEHQSAHLKTQQPAHFLVNLGEI